MKSPYIFIMIVLFVFLLVGYFLFRNQNLFNPTTSPTSAPTIVPTNTSTPSPNDSVLEKNITINLPLDQAQVGLNFTVKGTARVFENQFIVRLINERTGEQLFKQSVQSDAKDAGLFGNYSVIIDLPKNAEVKSGDTLVLQAFQPSPKDGSVIDSVIVKLIFK